MTPKKSVKYFDGLIERLRDEEYFHAYIKSIQEDAVLEAQQKLAIAIEALEKIKSHGCCVMHNNNKCPSCTAHEVLEKIK